jgi:hypothetical protein
MPHTIGKLLTKDIMFLQTSPQSKVCTQSYGPQSHGNPNFGNFTGGESCESMFAHGSFVHQKCFDCALTNLLFGLCRSTWIIDLLIIHPSPIPELQHTPLPPKCYKLRNAPQLLLLPLSSPLDSLLSLSKSLGVCQKGILSHNCS